MWGEGRDRAGSTGGIVTASRDLWSRLLLRRFAASRGDLWRLVARGCFADEAVLLDHPFRGSLGLATHPRVF